MRARLALLALLSAVGCNDKVPAKIDFSLPKAIFSSDQEVKISPSIRNRSGELINEVSVKFDVDPPATAVITQTGSLRCIKSGEAVIFAAAGPAVHSERVRCELVGRIKAPRQIRLIIPTDPVDPEVELFDLDGKAIRELIPQFEVKDSEVMTVQGGKFIPRQVGATSVTVSAGDKQVTVLVSVIQKVKREPLLLSDGARLNFTLGRGNYEAEVKVRSGNTQYGVTLNWVGGRGCQDHPEAQEITSRCTIDTTGAMIIENPTTLGLGPSADGYLAIYEVP